MPSVFGLLVDDPNQARTAKTLLSAHGCLIFIGLVSGIVGVISNVTFNNAVEDALSAVGFVNNNPRAGGNANIASIVIGIALPFLCPAIICIMVRSAIAGNNQGLLQCVCWFDGCCTCCTCLSGIFGIINCIVYVNLQKSVKSFNCNADSVSRPTDECAGLKDKAADGLGVVAALSVVAAVLSFMEMIACLLSTVKSNNAQNSLRMGQVFTGPPKTPMMQMTQGQMVAGQVYGGPAGFGGPAYGQVVSGQVVSGQVVGTPAFAGDGFGGQGFGGQGFGGQGFGAQGFGTAVYGQPAAAQPFGSPVVANGPTC